MFYLTRAFKMISNVERQEVWFFPFDFTRIGDKLFWENVAG